MNDTNETISDEKRQLIINAYNQGTKICKIVEIFNSKRSIIDIYLNEGRVKSKKRGGVTNRKITGVIKDRIQEIINEDCTKTLVAISSQIKTEFDVKFSKSSIHAYIKGFNFFSKRLAVLPVRRNPESTILQRKEYSDWFFRINLEHPTSRVYFIDEVGFQVSMWASYGRAGVV